MVQHNEVEQVREDTPSEQGCHIVYYKVKYKCYKCVEQHTQWLLFVVNYFREISVSAHTQKLNH